MTVRALLVAATLAAAAVLPGAVPAAPAAAPAYAAPVPDLPCDAGSRPETEQGRVSAADTTSGRAALGYTCNAQQVGSFGSVGGFRVEKYTDAAGHLCAYADSTLLLGRDVLQQTATGLGTYVFDMSDTAHPVQTATLTTPAMLSPHESLRVNAARGLLAADLGNPATNGGFVDVYDISRDCRHPVLDSSTPLGILGHESGFAPDGKTFYVSSTAGHTVDAVDLTNPKLPSILWATAAYIAHGMSLSADGDTLYMANDDPLGSGLITLDVSQVQHRVANPQVTEISRLTWPEVSIPQIAIPVTIKGHSYLVEDDEFTSATLNPTVLTPMVGDARIIGIDDTKRPAVVSDIRLAVDNAAYRGGSEDSDPGGTVEGQGYAAHYCSVPTQVDPTIMACSFILSGLRIFDIRDPLHPREIAYFNAPNTPASVPTPTPATRQGSYAMSSPNYDAAQHEVWYTDSNHGFFTVRLTGAAAAIAFPSAATTVTPPGGTTTTGVVAPVAITPVVVAKPGRTPSGGAPARATAPRQPTQTLAFTGLDVTLPALGVGLLVAGVGARRRRRRTR